MIAPNEKAISTHCRRRSNEILTIDSLTTSKRPVTTVIVYRNIAATTIQMMPRNPDSEPSAKAETAATRGMRKTTQETRNAASTP